MLPCPSSVLTLHNYQAPEVSIMEVTVPPWVASSSLAVMILLATALFLVTTTVLRRRGHRQRQATTRKRNLLPPGPRPWPVIGNLNILGALPHRSIHELSSRYGPLMSLRFGAFPAVVGSSVEVAEVLLKTQDLAYLDRPRMAGGKYTAYNYSSMVWSHYGPYWRQLRKLWITELLSARQLRLTESIRAEEVRVMLRDLHPTSMVSRRAVVLKEHLLMVTLNVISRMVLGKKYVGEDAGSAAAATPEEFRWMIEETFFLNAAPHVGDLVPWLSWLDPHGYVGRMKRLAKMFDRFIEHVLREHGDRRRREGDAFVPKDMVDQLLQLAEDPGLDVPLDRDGVKASVLELIAAGTDTTSVTLEWAMSELLRKPDVLGKITDELDRVVGRDRLVGEGDIPSLPYLEAVVKESMRLHPVAPLLFPRVSREDTTVAGYDVPVGTRVLVNVWAIGRDPAVWGDDAGEFRPERFLAGSRMSRVDVKGQDLELLPFGAGRRICPANDLGLRMVQLVLANLVHGYAWSLPGGMAPEELSMEEKFRISVCRMHQLQAIPDPRLPDHIYFVP